MQQASISDYLLLTPFVNKLTIQGKSENPNLENPA